MKRSDLEKHIEEIIMELLDETIQTATIDFKDNNTPDKVLRVDDTDRGTINTIKNDPKVNNFTVGNKVVKK